MRRGSAVESSSLSVAEVEEIVSAVECTAVEVMIGVLAVPGGGDVKAFVSGHRSRNSVCDDGGAASWGGRVLFSVAAALLKKTTENKCCRLSDTS